MLTTDHSNSKQNADKEMSEVWTFPRPNKLQGGNHQPTMLENKPQSAGIGSHKRYKQFLWRKGVEQKDRFNRPSQTKTISSKISQKLTSLSLAWTKKRLSIKTHNWHNNGNETYIGASWQHTGWSKDTAANQHTQNNYYSIFHILQPSK